MVFSDAFRSRFSRFVVAGALAAATVLAGGAAQAQKQLDLSPEQPGRLRGEKDPQAIAAIPAGFKFVKEGELTIGLAPSRPPLTFYATDARTVIGYHADLAQLIADSLDLKLTLVPVAWADWPLGLTSGRFDAVISNVTVTEERKEKFDFATYRQDTLGFYVKADSKLAPVKEPKDVAGLRVITDPGTNQERILLEWNRRNVEAGLKPIEVQYYDDDAVRGLAIESGRADGILSVNASLAHEASIKGTLKSIGTINGGWPLNAEIAVTTKKGNGLVEAFAVAINNLIANGKQAQILEQWNLSDEAVEKSIVNPPGLPKF